MFYDLLVTYAASTNTMLSYCAIVPIIDEAVGLDLTVSRAVDQR
jgi:hypothetical protein